MKKTKEYWQGYDDGLKAAAEQMREFVKVFCNDLRLDLRGLENKLSDIERKE